jgi:hypothetical protein
VPPPIVNAPLLPTLKTSLSLFASLNIASSIAGAASFGQRFARTPANLRASASSLRSAATRDGFVMAIWRLVREGGMKGIAPFSRSMLWSRFKDAPQVLYARGRGAQNCGAFVVYRNGETM